MRRPHKFGAVRTKRATPEHDLQRSIAQYLDAVLTKDVLWSSCDHAGKGAVRMKLLKARGVKNGWPDITLYWTEPTCVAGVFILEVGHLELKSAKGRMSTEQLEFAQRSIALGHHHAIVRGIDDLRKVLHEWDVPTRESK